MTRMYHEIRNPLMDGEDLETLLLRSNFITRTQLARATAEAERSRRRLTCVLIELGVVDERRFAEWMTQITSIPMVDHIPPEVVEPLVRRVPRTIAREYEVIPLAVDADTLTVAMANPLDSACREVLHLTTLLDVRPMVALHSSIQEMLARFYPEDSVEPTLMPTAFDPGATMALRPDDTPGSRTRSVKPQSQLDRIEEALNDLHGQVRKLHERIDAIDESLEHILSRR